MDVNGLEEEPRNSESTLKWNAFISTSHKAGVEDGGEMKVYDSDLKNYLKKVETKGDEAVEIP